MPVVSIERLESIEMQLEKQFQKMDMIRSNQMQIYGGKQEKKPLKNKDEVKSEMRIEQKID